VRQHYQARAGGGVVHSYGGGVPDRGRVLVHYRTEAGQARGRGQTRSAYLLV
jgi:hypothetical protein